MNALNFNLTNSLTPRFGASKKPLAVVDHYEYPEYAIAGDGLMKATHAAWVKGCARQVYPGVNLRDYPTETLGYRQCNPVSALEKLAADIKAGEEIGAVNMSLGISVKIRELADKLNLPGLTADNLPEYREEILAKLDEFDFSRCGLYETREMDRLLNGRTAEVLKRIIALVEEITAAGIPVFIAGGNDGKEAVNLLNLAKGMTGVGALKQDGEKVVIDPFESQTWWGSADNALLSEWERVFAESEPVIDGAGKLAGFRLIRPGETRYKRKRPDIPLSDVEVQGKRLLNTLLPLLREKTEEGDNPFEGVLDDVFTPGLSSGTSCAAPQAAARYLKELDD